MADRSSELRGRTEAERGSRVGTSGRVTSSARRGATRPRAPAAEVTRYEPEPTGRRGEDVRTGAQRAAVAMGAASAAIGALGLFAPVVTGNDDRIINKHNGKLLGIFAVNPSHAIAHLGLGVAGLVSGRSDKASRRYLETSGVVYGTLATAGFIMGRDRKGIYEFLGLALNTADNWLHTVWGGAAAIIAAQGERRTRGETEVEPEVRRRAA